MTTKAPLSKSMDGIYAECVGHVGEPYYNIPYLYVLDRSLDEERLRKAIEAAVANHPTLFTRIQLSDEGDAIQTVDDTETFSLSVETVEDIENEKQQMIVPFDIYGGRLFHIRLLKDDKHFYFLLDIHHMIADYTTFTIMLNDVDKAYKGETLEPEGMTLAEMSVAEAAVRQSQAFDEGRQWYAQNFDCADCFTQLIPDLEEPLHAEASVLRTLSIEMADVDAFCKNNGIFKSNFFTTAYAFLLAKYNNEQESLFTTIYNGRTDKRFLHSVGMTVRTLPVFSKFHSDTKVLDFLKAGQEQMTGVRKHEAYAFSDAVNDLGIQSNSMFAWHGMLFADEQLCGKPMKTIHLCNSTLEASLYFKAFILNGHYHVKAEYNCNEYSESLIRQFLESYEAVLKGFLNKQYLRDVDITTPQQINTLDSFNMNDVEYDDTQTIVSMFSRQAQETPDNIAVVYKDKRYSYAQVNEMSDRIAAYIASLLSPQETTEEQPVVSVLIPRSEWMVIASMGVLKAGCAYQPLDPSYPKERLNFMVKDAHAHLLIADKQLRELVDEYNGPVLLTKDLAGLPDRHIATPSTVKPQTVFILLYTSGSTGIPKGCQLTHANLVAFCHWYQRFYGLKPENNVAAYASYGFDASMMDMYPAITCGATVHIIPEELRLDLIALNSYFESEHITHSFMTTQVGFQFASNIDNHSLLHLSTGGEKLASITPPEAYRFYNVYGPTECTIFTTAYLVEKKQKDIPIGKPLDNMRLYIVDTMGRRLPVGAAGELWVSGPQVSRGYLNRPEKTAEVYIDNPFTDEKKYARVYRTGDIVRYLPDGNIQFVGRRDGQVKIRGFRIELKEVEAVIRDFPGIKDATVQAFDEEGGNGKFIAAYIVSSQQIDIEALNNFILDQKPPYMVPAVTMQIDAIPLNQNQKVNKRALPKPQKKAAVVKESNVPMNLLEQELHNMVAAIVNNNDFGVTTILGFVGLTSISAIKLAVQVNKRFGVTLDSRELVKTGTIQSIENEILASLLSPHEGNAQSADAGGKQNLSPKEGRESAPLSYAQTGVYFECLKNPTSTIYNIPYMLTFPQGTDPEALADAVKRVVESHPELQVHFATEGEDIIQTIDHSLHVEVPVNEMTLQQLHLYKNDFVQPFNLQKAPLYRFEVVKTEHSVALLMDIHHLLFDGASADIFIRQLCSALEGAQVEKENYTYLDFVDEQLKAEDTQKFKESKLFFDQMLKSCEGASEIPADLTKTDKQGLIGEAVCPVDNERLKQQLSKLNAQGSSLITPAHLFLAATAYVVSRYTNNRQVFISTVSSGRSNLKIADTVGMFVNTLPLAISIDDVSVYDFLINTSDIFQHTLQHEEYPFARIAADYGFRPAIAFAYQVGVLSEYKVAGQTLRQELLELNVPKFKINIKIETRGVVVQFDDALYSHATGYALAESIAAVAERMLEQHRRKVRQLSIVSKTQELQLSSIRQQESSIKSEPPFSFFHDCIAHFAKIQPQHVALVASDATFNYQQMNTITDSIANGLRQKGVKQGDRVALLLPRNSRLIFALFAVMKAGAAYIPCDPEYPADRVKLILEDSQASFIITTADRICALPQDNAIDVEELVQYPAVPMQPTTLSPDDLAYLIYTSGSTGRPKGVMLRHEGICNYLYPHPANVFAHAVLTDASRILSVTTISFDAALQDIGMAFYNGKTLILATEEQANNPIELAKLIKQQNIDMVSGTPSRWMTWLTSPLFCSHIANLKICRAGGEKFTQALLDKLRNTTKARIFNCYGPTEITVASNNAELTQAQIVTVGKPQLNVREFIVDADGNELPVGVVGELYIGGTGVARGYNNLEQMTRERFISYHNTRVYRSGDYAKWMPDGNVIILGRTDHQIKLRGLRIELGEIENVILNVKGIKKVVIIIRLIAGKEHLCAYYTADHNVSPIELKDEISKSLTQYMVPTAYLQLDEMPLTPNGKTDIKALPQPVLAISSSYEQPANNTELTFCNIFADILQIDKVGANDNFFELGGTSLVVTRIIIEADKAGLHVAYGDVFANPTPRLLAKLVQYAAVPQQPPTPSSDDNVTDFDYTAINNILSLNNLNTFRQGQRQQLGNVMLTGATGYLGIHILHQLINSDARNIYCIVRANSLDKAERRLRTLLFYYFADAYKQLFGKRIHVLLGDVTTDLRQVCGDTVAASIDTLFNCAAVVKHFAQGTEIEDVNIGGAQRCIDFCISTHAKLIHISTASTRGMWVQQNDDNKQQPVFNEQQLYIGQYLGNKYIYSKFIAERLILQAVATQQLSAKIMRVGNLAPRSTDGEFQANFSTNSFMGRIKIYNMLKCCPYDIRNKQVEFSPINEVSRAIILLATTPRQCTVFHPYNIHGQFLGDVLAGLKAVGKGISFVEHEEFINAMEQAKNDPQKARLLASLIAYQDMAHGQKTADVQRDNNYTTQVLYRLQFSWSPTSWDYVERMLTALGGFGFFE